ncbi:OTOF protein, partial [Amia calva]|nr:OTOF protein [Amia calva]
QHFRWPHYGKVIRDEMLSVSVYNSSKVFSNRLVGKLVISLQHVVSAGRVMLREPLTDKNYSLTDIYIELDVRYEPVEGTAGGWQSEEFLNYEDPDDSALVIRNAGFSEPGSKQALRPERLDRETRKLGRSLVKDGEEEGHDGDDDDDDDDYDVADIECANMTFTPILRGYTQPISLLLPLCNFLFEFQENQEVLFDKVIEISVVHKKTLAFMMTRIGTFKIDISTVYNQPDHRFYQKWAPLTDPKDTRTGIKGYVKCTMSVVAKGDAIGMPSIPPAGSQNDDIEKNLLLPKRMPVERPWAKFLVKIFKAEGLPSMNSGFMGSFSKMMGEKKVFIDPYVQVTFAGQQGETSVETDTNAPEWNEQISFIEQFPPLARRIKVQVLDDANIGDVALATHFLDLQQISDPTRNGFHPTFGPSWINLYGSPQNSVLRDVHRDLNEGLGQGIFYRGRVLLSLSVEVYSSPTAVVENKALAAQQTHPEEEEQEVQGEEEKGQGSCGYFRFIFRLLQNFLGEKEEFLLFASLFDVTMIDPSIGTKPVSFELSIGNYGKAAEVVVKSKKREARGVGQGEDRQPLMEGSEDELEREELANPPGSRDRSFSCIPLLYEKPCIYVWNYWEDHCFRLHISNWLSKMADRLEHGIDEVEKLLKRPKSQAKERLVEVLLELVASCKQYSSQADKKTVTRPNNLDRSRLDFLKKNVLSLCPVQSVTLLCPQVLLAKQALRVRRRITVRTVREKLGDVKKILRRVRFLAKEPQSTLPDVFLWLLSGEKRLAYARIPVHSILYSVVEEEKGKDCGKVHTVYMKCILFPKELSFILHLEYVLEYLPQSVCGMLVSQSVSRSACRVSVPSLQTPGGPVGEIFAKLEVYMWLGVTKYVKNSLSSLPAESMQLVSQPAQPSNLGQRTESFQNYLTDGPPSRRSGDRRCVLWSGSLQGSSVASGPQSLTVLEETLSPTWSQLLLFEQILIEGSKDELKADPPVIVINIYDYDKFGSPEFIGRAFAEPEMKFAEEPYKKPALQFFDISKGKAAAGELLAAFELIELDYSGFGEPSLPQDVDPRDPVYLPEEKFYIIPEGVRPVLKKFRIEVLYWGLRDLKRVNLFEVERPQVRMECSGQRIESEEIQSYKLNPNFSQIIKHFDVELPELVYLHPPLTIFVFERRAFGRLVLVGTHVVQTLMNFAPKDLDEWKEEEEEEPQDKKPPKKVTPLNTVINMDLRGLPIRDTKIPINPINLVTAPLKKGPLKLLKEEELEEEEPEKEELDWWSKYYASLAELENQNMEDEEENEEQTDAEGGNLNMATIEAEEDDANVLVEVEPPKPKRKMICTLKLYKSELENEFEEFMDWLHTFPIYKGRANCENEEEDEEERTMGKYKGSFLIYPISQEDEDAECKITKGIPKNVPIKVLVRVYVVKATNLAPTDPNGKADPYVVVKVGQQQMDSKDHYIPKQLNPVFGEVFELTVSFPLETELSLMVYDHDLVGSDDLIGETRIDLENRLYSRHRAACGLALYYDKEGYNQWHDAKKPTAILADLCRKNGIPSPEYREAEVKVLNKLVKKNKKTEEDILELDEHKALSVLHRWAEMREFSEGACALVPEHVEIRSLLNSEKPGLAQGYVHMWIDMFPVDVPAPPPVNIKPRLPISYELRVIIWNADDVVLDDVNPFTGELSSDIYIKGWIKGLEDEKQETDVHFNSLTGEGNFNWRFVFRFDYLPTEKELTYKKKESIFSLDESEFRQPAVLVLQVWDYDRIGANDFLGSIELRLNDMVRAAKSSDQCSVKMAKDKASPRFSIFRSKRMKGWWPLIKLKSQEGKVEAEFQLVTVEEAEKNPVGRARKEPEPLDKPNRPKTSFNWFVNPMKTCIFFIWKKYKKYIIALIVLVILTLFLFLILYTLPGQISGLIVNG